VREEKKGRNNILRKLSHKGRRALGRCHTNQLRQRGLDPSKTPADLENKLTIATKSD